MRNMTITIVSIVAVLVIGIFTWLYVSQDANAPGDTETPPQPIASFEECMAAGYSVAESYPRQCSVPDGGTFTETLEDESATFTSSEGVEILLQAPRVNQTVTSPLIVQGEVPGSWSFEANFPVRLLDANGEVLVESFATLQGDWMTTDYVPFEVEIEFESPVAGTGTLILEKANASGLPENDDQVSIEVQLLGQ